MIGLLLAASLPSNARLIGLLNDSPSDVASCYISPEDGGQVAPTVLYLLIRKGSKLGRQLVIVRSK